MVAPTVSHTSLPRSPEPRGGPSLTGRAVLALAFLVGFYVLALAAVGALVAANVALYSVAGRTSPSWSWSHWSWAPPSSGGDARLRGLT